MVVDIVFNLLVGINSVRFALPTVLLAKHMINLEDPRSSCRVAIVNRP